MTTVADILNLALKDAGVIGTGQTASAEDTSDAFSTLKQMIAQWQIDGLMVYATAQVSFNLTGAQSYAVGSGGTINTTRPKEIISAFWRDGSTDTPLDVLAATEDYQRIEGKTDAGTPECVFYSPSNPLGTLYVHPVGSSGAIHLTVLQPLTSYTSTADDLALPAEYELAARFCLAELLSSVFGTPLRPDVAAQAKKCRKLIKRNNLRIPALQMPAQLVRHSFDIESGR
jgi:hypothetical protein